MKPVQAFIWHRWWVYGWTFLLFLIIVAAIVLPWWWWLIIAAVGFLAPEIYAVINEPSAAPPLTSILRRYLPSYAAFPLLGYTVGFVTTVLITERAFLALVIGLAAALGFWLIEHFASTYFRLHRKSRR